MSKYPNYQQNFSTPIFAKDLYSFANYTVNWASPIESRIASVSLNIFMKTFVFHNNIVAKDANPTVGNVIREIPGLLTTSLNAWQGHPITKNKPNELQDTMHVLGQGIRLVCKLSFQAIAPNEEYKVIFSRASNIFCDGIGVTATEISRSSQREKISLYYLYPSAKNNVTETEKKEVAAIDYLYKQLTWNYMMQILPKSTFRSLACDQIGEVIKIATNSNGINYVSSSLNKMFYSIVQFSSGINIDHTKDIYTIKNDALAQQTNYLVAYTAVGFIASYKLIYNIVPDLFIIGTLLLSTSNQAVNYMGSLSLNEMATPIILISSAAYYKTAVTNIISASSPALGIVAVSMLYDPLYEATKEYVEESINYISSYYTETINSFNNLLQQIFVGDTTQKSTISEL